MRDLISALTCRVSFVLKGYRHMKSRPLGARPPAFNVAFLVDNGKMARAVFDQACIRCLLQLAVGTVWQSGQSLTGILAGLDQCRAAEKIGLVQKMCLNQYAKWLNKNVSDSLPICCLAVVPFYCT